MKRHCNETFIRKTSGYQLYKWSPLCNQVNKTGADGGLNSKPYFCSAISGSLGEDWITTYVYDIVVTNGVVKHLAYVECDYVA